MALPIVAFGIFKLAVVLSGAHFVVRIRRADGKPILCFGEASAALGTKPCLTEAEAIEEAKAIIKRKRLDRAG